MVVPFIVVIPGIVAYVMFMQPEGTTVIPGVQEAFTNTNGAINYDKAYPWLISVFIPTGLKRISACRIGGCNSFFTCINA